MYHGTIEKDNSTLGLESSRAEPFFRRRGDLPPNRPIAYAKLLLPTQTPRVFHSYILLDVTNNLY
jgi:hypothetical protein